MRKLNTLTEIILTCKDIDQKGITFIKSSDEQKKVTYDQCFKNAHYILHHLIKNGLQKGDEVIFQIADNESFVNGFWGCILGGICPVPISIGNNIKINEKLFNVWKVLKRPFLLVDRNRLNEMEEYAKAHELQNVFDEMKSKCIYSESILEEEVMGTPQISTPDDLAFIQFSSGSTGLPKGVMLSHENLITNIKAIDSSMNSRSDDKALSWMPLTHDMGLIGFLLTPMMQKIDLFLMPTTLFVRNPSLWMKKVHEHRATVLSSPNFGYSYYLSRFKEKENIGLDLSSVRLIFNGAEPISVRNINTFLDHMEPYNLSRNSIFNVYGLAEASLAVTFPGVNEPLNYICVDRTQLGIGDNIKIVSEKDTNHARIVEVGMPIPESYVVIRSESSVTCPENVVGFIHIKGKNVTKGYYGDETLKQDSFSEGGWFKTGDLGFFYKERLYVTGRYKDILFINGQNYYAHDIEGILSEQNQFSKFEMVVIGLFDKSVERDKFIIFVNYKKNIHGFLEIYKAIAKCIKNTIGVEPDHIVPVKSIPKTTSGKIQRYMLVKSFEHGTYNNLIDELGSLLQEDNMNLVVERSKTKTEDILSRIVNMVLNIEQVDVTKNLTDFIGSSLQLIAIHSEIEEVFLGKVKISDFFAYPSIRELAMYIDTQDTEPFQSIPLPKDFFCQQTTQEEWVEFEEGLSVDLVKEVFCFCEKNEINTFDLMVYAFFVIFQKITQLEDVAVKGLVKGEKSIRNIDLTFVKDKNLMNGIKSIHEYFCKSVATEVTMDMLQSQRIFKGTHGILPLIVEGNHNDNAFKTVFDLTLHAFIQTNDITLYWGFNGLRLRKVRIIDMSHGFITLIKLIVNG